MRILWVKANKLLPVDIGANIRSYHILRYLSQHHDLVFFSYYNGARDVRYEQDLHEQLPGSIAFCTGKSEVRGVRRGLDYLRRLHSPAPYAVSRFACRRVQQAIGGLLEQRQFNIAVCDFLDAAVNFPRNLRTPVVLFQHNVESEIWRRHARIEVNPIKKLVYEMEFRKMLRYESATVRRFVRVIAVSEHDRQLMGKWIEPARVSVVPTGVDLRQYRAASSKKDCQPLVLFVGAMDWEPNSDAVQFFCSEIWPLVLEKVPQARFRIVGRNPGARVLKLASTSVHVTGHVPSVLEHLQQAAVVVVPLRIGGGTRLKIYEAMAMGKAVVSTSVGAEGLDVHPGKDILLEDRPHDFAQRTAMLLTDREVRDRFGKAALETAAQYDWAKIGESFANLLRNGALRNASPARDLVLAAQPGHSS